MTSPTEHVRDEIQDLLDGRLEASARERVEAHLAGCDSCERERRALARVRESLHSLRRTEVPADFREAVSAVLDREDARAATSRTSRSRLPRPALLAAAAAVILLGALAVFLARPKPLPERVARDYSDFRAGRLRLQLETGDAAALNKFFADGGVRFRTRVLDLGMMGYRLAGGSVLGGRRKRAFFVYRGEGGRLLACQMYEGDLRALRHPPEVRQRSDFTFLVFRESDQTQVFWQEGDVVCVLASDMPSEEIVQLALAKAMKP
jgi:anti-sigma factor RsiW